MNRPSGLDWSPSEAAAVNEFLNTPVGQKWLGVLMVRKPRMDLGTTERAALSGAYAAGYESIFSIMAETRVARAPDQNASAPSINPDKD